MEWKAQRGTSTNEMVKAVAPLTVEEWREIPLHIEKLEVPGERSLFLESSMPYCREILVTKIDSLILLFVTDSAVYDV